MINLDEERKIFKQNYKMVGGIDEAGRGPLAGPVVASCVVLNQGVKLKNKEFFKVKDSKKLTEKKREELYDVIMEEFNNVGIGICWNEIIDRINILQATFLAMKQAVSLLKIKPDFILIDGNLIIPNSSYKQKAIIRGDEQVFSIAIASIIAKVTRDRIMKEMHKKYPEYGFDRHKGYGTKFHMECLKKYGASPIHRRSFKPVRVLCGIK